MGWGFFFTKVSDLLESFINRPLRQLVGKTRWVFRQPQGLSTAWASRTMISIIGLIEPLDWTHSADGRPSGSSLQAIEQKNGQAVEQRKIGPQSLKKT
jgi:hypothetical protein